MADLDLTIWNPRVGSSGDDKYNPPDDSVITAGTVVSGTPTMSDIDNGNNFGQSIMLMKRRADIYATVAGLQISNCIVGSPNQITFYYEHGLTSGQYCYFAGLIGVNFLGNQSVQVTVTGIKTVTVSNIWSGTWTSGGGAILNKNLIIIGPSQDNRIRGTTHLDINTSINLLRNTEGMSSYAAYTDSLAANSLIKKSILFYERISLGVPDSQTNVSNPAYDYSSFGRNSRMETYRQIVETPQGTVTSNVIYRTTGAVGRYSFKFGSSSPPSPLVGKYRIAVSFYVQTWGRTISFPTLTIHAQQVNDQSDGYVIEVYRSNSDDHLVLETTGTFEHLDNLEGSFTPSVGTNVVNLSTAALQSLSEQWITYILGSDKEIADGIMPDLTKNNYSSIDIITLSYGLS
jgi:hypothetical protein